MNDPSLVEKVAEAMGPAGRTNKTSVVKWVLAAITAAGYVVVQGPVTEERECAEHQTSEGCKGGIGQYPCDIVRVRQCGPWLPVDHPEPPKPRRMKRNPKARAWRFGETDHSRTHDEDHDCFGQACVPVEGATP